MIRTTLDPERVVATAARLRDRIHERFPEANLGKVATTLLEIARDHTDRVATITRPNRLLQATSATLLLLGIGAVGALLMEARLDTTWTLAETLQSLEAGLSMSFFLGAAAIYVLSLDLRQKRRRCLQALHELRALAHIVDMHQLTKDPDGLQPGRPDTPSSPDRTLTRFELARYLDYCSEMLSIMGKIAAIYVQDFPDPQAVAAVDDIEDLTTGLSRKIWQKIMILGPSAVTGGDGTQT
ncbi:MAG: hypothetical protein JNK78_00850 [Planctomycetes bacterium]|nr:hypothetical protein [Planctomycetota bacterium]